MKGILRMTENSEIMNTVKIAVDAINEKKGLDVKVIDISSISIMADYFILASGSNVNQIKAICDNLTEKLGKANVHPKHIEGNEKTGWILLDYTDVIIHIFDEDSRAFYNLERIWSDGKDVAV